MLAHIKGFAMIPGVRPAFRQKVILEEMTEGRAVWPDMPATINGEQVTVSACMKWGAFMLGDRMVVLSHSRCKF